MDRLGAMEVCRLNRKNVACNISAASHVRLMQHLSCSLSFQKRRAGLVDSDYLEMAEDIPHEIDCGAFHRQSLCAFIGDDDSEAQPSEETIERHARTIIALTFAPSEIYPDPDYVSWSRAK
jgi:hypothetical protein